jgi:hypothetical protein
MATMKVRTLPSIEKEADEKSNIQPGIQKNDNVELVRIRPDGTSEQTTRDCITGEQRPILELRDVGNRVLKVVFVRSKVGCTLRALLAATIRYATTGGFQRVEIDDDALFPTLNSSICPHRALFRRAFDGKSGIYETYGWKPRVNTIPLVATLYSYTKSNARELHALICEARLLSRMPRAAPTTFLNTISMASFASNDTGRFGSWLNAQSCDIVTHFYNALLVLSADRWRTKIMTRPNVTAFTKTFLQALHEFRMANKCLYKNI